MQPNLLNILSSNNIIIFMLILTRITGLFQSAPFFSSIQAPLMTKVWFAGTISFIMYPLIKTSKFFIMPHDMVEFAILLSIEFLIGYLIGFVANLIIEATRMTGNILSIQTGLSMAEALDPATGVSSNEISKIYTYLATLIFIGSGAYQMLFVTLYNSFQALPMGVFPLFDVNIISGLMQLFSHLFKVAFGLALPIFAVLLLSDLLLGIMSKTMPQMNIYMVAIPIKIYMGLILIFAFLSTSAIFLQTTISNYIQAINSMFN